MALLSLLALLVAAAPDVYPHNCTYKQGGTGSVTRACADKLADALAAKEFGAKCDGATDDAPALALANTAAVAQGKAIFIGCKLRIASAAGTVAAGLRFEGAGALDLSPVGGSVTLTGPLTAPVKQIFFTGSGALTFSAKVAQVVPQWWGAKGDGATDDTAAVAAARAVAAVNGKILLVPQGTYKINCGSGGALDFGTLPFPFAFILRGEGQQRSFFQCNTAGTLLQFATQVGNNFSNGIEIADIGLVGFGSSDGTLAHGILDNDVDNGTNNIFLHDLAIRAFSGNCVYIQKEFSIRLVSVYANDCGLNNFDIAGGNTTTLLNTYAQTVSAGHAGYRIHSSATLISANGINNTWGTTSGTGLSEDQADWGVFGNEILTAWAQNTAYTVGQLRQANGAEFECITAGTSDVAGTGPNAISKDIIDGTAHWRHVGQADTTTNFAKIALINCNVEAFTRSGLRLKNGSSIDLLGSDINNDSGAPANSAGLVGLWYSGSIDPQQKPTLIDGLAFADQAMTSYEHASAIHVSNTTPAFVRLGGTTNNPLVWTRTLLKPAFVPTITTVQNGATGLNVYYATALSRLVVNAGPLTLTRVAPTYGASVIIDHNLGNLFDITATNGTAFTVGNPGPSGDATAGAASGMRITIRIINTSGGVLGVITWGTKYKMTAFTAPATGFNRSIEFVFDGTNWNEINRGAADVPN